MRILSSLLLLALAAQAAGAEDGKQLVPPPGYTAPVGQRSGEYSCPQAPEPFTGALDFPSKYAGSGKSRDKLNEDSDAEYKQKTRPVTDREKGVAKVVGAYMQNGKLATLDCALDWYMKWADAGALLGPAPSHTGKSVRKWTLGSLSAAYLRLKFSQTQPLQHHADKQREIEEWLGKIADKVVQEWDANAPIDKFNNHYYWSAWSAMATGVALNRQDLFDWSVKIYDRFAGQVDNDGYLPNELNRKTRALGYHLFALPPVSMIAAFGAANGVDLAGRGNGALKRAGNRTIQGFDDPKIFEARAGERQVMEGFDEKSSKLAWLEPYCSVATCEGSAAKHLEASRPFKNSRLGGDVTAVFRR